MGDVVFVGKPELGTKETLRRLSERCVIEVFNGNILAFAEAFAEARIAQIADLVAEQVQLFFDPEVTDEILQQCGDLVDELDDAMISVMLQWLDEDIPRDVVDIISILRLNERRLCPH